jgi:integrase
MPTPIRKNPTVFPYRGKWRLSYPDKEGNTRTRAVESKQEAYRLLMAMGWLDANNRTLHTDVTVPTVLEWFEQWFIDHASDVRPTTLRNNLCLTRKHIIPALGHLRLNEVTPLLVEHFYRDLIDTKRLSASSVHRIHATMTVPFKGAVRFGIIPSSPLLSVSKPRATKPRIRPLTREECEQIWEALCNCPANLQLRWKLALRYGLRQGEALALHFTDFDLNTQSLTIDKQLQHTRNEGFVFTPPKSEKGIRTIPIDAELVELCQAAFADAQNAQGLILTDSAGKPLHASTDSATWARILKSAGVRKVTVHTARHTAATQMIASGVDVKTVQVILGHSTPSFTLATYVHPSVEDLRNSLAPIAIKAPTTLGA